MNQATIYYKAFKKFCPGAVPTSLFFLSFVMLCWTDEQGGGGGGWGEVI